MSPAAGPPPRTQAWLSLRGALRLTALALGLTSALACEQQPSPSLARINTETSGDAALAQLTDQVAFQRHEFERRLQVAWELPTKPKDVACSTLASGTVDADTLVVLVQDARVDSRQLLSLHLTNELTSRDLEGLEPHYDPSSKAGARRRLRSKRDGELLHGALQALSARRYAAVFHVTHLAAPKFFHDPKKRKPEWSPGWMHGFLAIHELGEPDALCQWRVEVRSDTSKAALERRLRETTLFQLAAELGARFREAGVRAHEQLGTGLTWPKRAR